MENGRLFLTNEGLPKTSVVVIALLAVYGFGIVTGFVIGQKNGWLDNPRAVDLSCDEALRLAVKFVEDHPGVGAKSTVPNTLFPIVSVNQCNGVSMGSNNTARARLTLSVQVSFETSQAGWMTGGPVDHVFTGVF